MGNSKQLMSAALVAIGLFLFWVFPYSEYQKIATLQDALAERDTMLKERNEIQVQINELATEYNQQTNAVRNLRSVIPTKKELAEAVSGLQAMSSESGVQLLQVTFTETTTKVEQPYGTMRLSLSGKGSYSGIRSFLGALERSIRLIDVQSINLSRDEQSSELNFKIDANAYFLK